jgi:hypothetical protein
VNCFPFYFSFFSTAHYAIPLSGHDAMIQLSTLSSRVHGWTWSSNWLQKVGTDKVWTCHDTRVYNLEREEIWLYILLSLVKRIIIFTHRAGNYSCVLLWIIMDREWNNPCRMSWYTWTDATGIRSPGVKQRNQFYGSRDAREPESNPFRIKSAVVKLAADILFVSMS